MTEQPARRRGRPRKVVDAAEQAAPAEKAITIGWRRTWTTRGPAEPYSTVTIPADEADRIVAKGLARHA